MKNWKAILSTALILGYILLCVFTIPYFMTEALHFRGEIYEITKQDGYTVYTCKDKTITVTSGDRIEVTFRTDGALTAQYTVQKNGDAVTVFDENGFSVLSGIWKRGALYGEHDTLDSTYQETAAVKKREFLPFPAEALSVAMGVGLGPRGWHWLIVVPLGICVVAVSSHYPRSLSPSERDFLHKHGMGSDVEGYVERYLKK